VHRLPRGKTITQPTVVLVRGAFADASSYAAVIPELLAYGLRVVAPAVPNRSLIGDRRPHRLGGPPD
jgi:hypothetical protein